MGEPHGFGHAAGVMDVLTRTARAFAVHGLAMVIELQGHAHDLIARTMQHRRHDRAVHAAGHGRHHAMVGRLAAQIEKFARQPVFGHQRVHARFIKGRRRHIRRWRARISARRVGNQCGHHPLPRRFKADDEQQQERGI